jgi:hypothetical protein
MRIHILTVCVFTIMYSPDTRTFSWEDIYSYMKPIVPGKMQQEIVYEEYNPKNATVLRIKNKKGNVVVKADKNQSKVSLKAIKKSSDTEQLPQLTFACTPSATDLIVEATYDEAKTAGLIDFELVVPATLAVNVHTAQGNICARHLGSPCILNTQKGDIEVSDSAHCVDACTHNKGNISFNNCHKRIKGQTQYGTIKIFDAHESIFARTYHGAIEMFAREVPSTSTIKLSTVSGQIILHLPPDINADLQATTQRGVITSQPPVTLRAQTIPLNSTTWRMAQKNINGILGDIFGNSAAQIKLSSIHSNIKLLERKSPERKA